MQKSKVVTINGNQIYLVWDDRGFWIDAKGTVWPDIWDDPAYCGLDPVTTGPWDPFWKRTCKPHDTAFAALKTGYKGNSPFKVFGSFVGSTLETMAQGAYALAAGPAYILIGGVGGLLRWAQIKLENNV